MSQQTSTVTPTEPMALTGDAASLVAVLDHLRAAGVDVSELTVGAVSIKLRGTVRAGGDREDRDDSPERHQQAIYRQMGGDMFERMITEKVPGVDLQPAIGRRAG